MKRILRTSLLIAFACCLVFSMAACGDRKEKNDLADDVGSSEILVVYFSCTGTTERVANLIAEVTDGTKYAIKPIEPYTQADLNYGNSDSRATKEQNDPNARPEIDGEVQNIENYDVIFLGYPIWWGDAPKIIYTFLESYDLSDKTIVPFCTSGSTGISTSQSNLKRIESTAKWLNGRRFSNSTSKSEIQNWITDLEL